MSRLKKIFKKVLRSPYLIGAGCAFNIAGNYYRYNFLKPDPYEDVKAIASDWKAIGKDFNYVMKKI